VCQRASRCWIARRALKALKLQARDVSNLRQQKEALEVVVAELKRELGLEGEIIAQLKGKIVELEKENVVLQASASAAVGGGAEASHEDVTTSANAAQLQAAQARCIQLEQQLEAACVSLQHLQKLYDDSRDDVAAAQAQTSSVCSELDKLRCELSAAQLHNERLSVSSAKLAAAAAQSPTATNFYKSQASPVTHDPTVEPSAPATMHAAVVPRRGSQDNFSHDKDTTLLEKGQMKFQSKRALASPPLSPHISAAPPRTPASNIRDSFHGSPADFGAAHISVQSMSTADDALAGIRAVVTRFLPAAHDQKFHSHAELYSVIKSLCSEVTVLRRVVTNTEERGGASAGGAPSPRTPRSSIAFVPYMPVSPVIPSHAEMPERVRMVEVCL
jgi:hypothetical protein